MKRKRETLQFNTSFIVLNVGKMKIFLSFNERLDVSQTEWYRLQKNFYSHEKWKSVEYKPPVFLSCVNEL